MKDKTLSYKNFSHDAGKRHITDPQEFKKIDINGEIRVIPEELFEVLMQQREKIAEEFDTIKPENLDVDIRITEEKASTFIKNLLEKNKGLTAILLEVFIEMFDIGMSNEEILAKGSTEKNYYDGIEALDEKTFHIAMDVLKTLKVFKNEEKEQEMRDVLEGYISRNMLGYLKYEMFGEIHKMVEEEKIKIALEIMLKREGILGDKPDPAEWKS